MIYVLLILKLMFGEPANECTMTYFGGKSDKLRGGRSPCTGKRISSTDWGVAMRGKKCGTLIWLRNPKTGKTVVAPIIDKGPYGAGSKKDGTWYIKKKRRQPGPDGVVRRWRGCGDLTKPVSRALGHTGFHKIQWEVLE